jgi:hypothetical protein
MIKQTLSSLPVLERFMKVWISTGAILLLVLGAPFSLSLAFAADYWAITENLTGEDGYPHGKVND